MSTQEASQPEAITGYLSADRFGTYLRYSTQSPAAALALYEWNSRLAGELMIETGIVEVLIRNAMGQHLSASADQRETVHRWEIAALDVRGRRDLDQARQRATRRQGANLAEVLVGGVTSDRSQERLADLEAIGLRVADRPTGDHLRSANLRTNSGLKNSPSVAR